MAWVAVIGAGGAIIGGVLANKSAKSANAAAQAAKPGEPPQWLQNQQQLYAQKSNEAYNQQFDPYNGQRVAQMNGYQQGAFDPSRYSSIGSQTALQGQGSAALSDMLGQYKENPALQGMIDKSGKDISAGLGAAGLGSGSFGNAGVAQQGANALSDSATGLRFQDYNNWQDRRLAATPVAGQYGQNQFNNQLGLANAQQGLQERQGNLQYGIDQGNLDTGYQNYLTAQNWPLRQLDILRGASQINGGMSQPQPLGQNPMAAGLGGAIVGGQLASSAGNYFMNGNKASTGIQPGQNANSSWGFVDPSYTGGLGSFNPYGGN